MNRYGGTYAGGTKTSYGFRYNGATYSGTTVDETRTTPPGGLRYNRSTYGGLSGGTYESSDRPISELIDIDGFAIALEREDNTRVVFSERSPAKEIISLEYTEEVNNMASWEAQVPASDEIYEFPFARCVIAYNGERLFHGTMLPVSTSEGVATIGGFDNLFWGTSGNMEVSYQGAQPNVVLQDVWNQVAIATDGYVSGIVANIPTSHANQHRVPQEGVSWSGTPLSVLKEAHGYFGMAFTFNRNEKATIGESFVPGEQTGLSDWDEVDSTTQIDPKGYHNVVSVDGAGEANATVKASTSEIESVLHGKEVEYSTTNTDLTSDEACRAFANSKLQELRGNYTVTGSIETTPTTVTPGYKYRTREFDANAPDTFAPTSAILQSVSHSYQFDEVSTKLEFNDRDGIVGEIRDSLQPQGAITDVSRRIDGEKQVPEGYGTNWGQNWGH